MTPPPDDGTVQVPVSIPDSEGESSMPLADNLHEQNMSALGAAGAVLGPMLAQSGNIAQNNFITVQKVVDYDYLENKRMVTLDEAVGIREVQSQVNPGGPGPRS